MPKFISRHRDSEVTVQAAGKAVAIKFTKGRAKTIDDEFTVRALRKLTFIEEVEE